MSNTRIPVGATLVARDHHWYSKSDIRVYKHNNRYILDVVNGEFVCDNSDLGCDDASCRIEIYDVVKTFTSLYEAGCYAGYCGLCCYLEQGRIDK